MEITINVMDDGYDSTKFFYQINSSRPLIVATQCIYLIGRLLVVGIQNAILFIIYIFSLKHDFT